MDTTAVRLPVPELSSNTRSALIVATSQYSDPALTKLRAPVHDAEDLARVLGDPAIGGFIVTTVVDQPDSRVSMAIAEFLKDRGPDETVLVYLSCHGIQDRAGRLCFAATNTVKDQPRFTSVKSADLLEELDDCRARQQILILDCCFSGAFSGGRKGGQELMDHFVRPGRGRVVLTASRSYEYSFEGEALGDAPAGSVFTTGLVEGIRSGRADTDGDGYIAWDEAFAYAERYAQDNGAHQNPQQWLSGGEGAKIILARSPQGQLVIPVQLPEDLAGNLTSRSPDIRIGAVNAVAHWLHDPNPARVIAAEAALLEVARQDNPRVAAVARARLKDSARADPPDATDSQDGDGEQHEPKSGSHTDEAKSDSYAGEQQRTFGETGTDNDDTGRGWRRKKPWFTRFLIAVSGASPEILEFFPQDRVKYIAFGSIITAISVLTALGIYFVLRTALTEPLITSAVIALFSGLVVLAVDRWLIVTLPRSRNSSKKLLWAIPRLLFALLVSAIIAGPITLQVFRAEVDQQVLLTNVTRSANFNRQLETNGIGAQVAKDQTKVDQLLQAASSSSKENTAARSVAKNELPAAQQKLAIDQRQEEQQESTFDKANSDDTGLPASIAALISVCSTNAIVCIASVVIFLFFASVNVLPLAMQTMLSSGSESAYEHAVSYDNDIAFQAAATMRRRQIDRILGKDT